MDNPIQILNTDGFPIRESMSSGYDGAGVGFGNQLSTWAASSKSADANLLPAFDIGNARAADLSRNDAYAKSGVQLHVDHIVGHQFKLVYKPNYLLLGLERDSQEYNDFVKLVEAKWSNFADDSRCYLDTERKRTFTMLVREAVATHCKTGEITAKADWFTKRGTKYKTAIQLINYARISNPHGEMNSSTLRGGVEMDKRGAAIAYHVRKAHPNDFLINNNSHEWVRIPKEMKWGRLQFIHIFEPDGEGQSRGANAFFASLSKLKMLDKFQATTLQNAIVNAMYAAVIESDMNSEEVFKAIGSSGSENTMLANFMNAKADWHEQTNINLAGVKIPHLLPSEKLTLQSVSAPSSSLNEFESGILRGIARSLGVSYEQLSGDFSKTNYSSARAAMGESFLYFMGKRETVAKRFASNVFELWFEEALNIGDIVLPKGANLNYYEAKTAWTRCNWIGSGKVQIDGLKAIKESKEKISAGLSTYEIELGNDGLDYQEVFDQQARETEELAKMGREPIWAQSKKEEKPELNENPEVDTNAD